MAWPKRQYWTPEMDAVLRELWPTGEPQWSIGKKLGRSQGAISHRVIALDLPPRATGRKRGLGLKAESPLASVARAPSQITPAMLRLAAFDPIVRRSVEMAATQSIHRSNIPGDRLWTSLGPREARL